MNTFTRYVNYKQLVSIFAFGCGWRDGMAQLSSLSCKQNTLELPVQNDSSPVLLLPGHHYSRGFYPRI